MALSLTRCMVNTENSCRLIDEHGSEAFVRVSTDRVPYSAVRNQGNCPAFEHRPLYAAHYEGIPRAFPYGLLVIGFVATIKEFRYQVILHAFPYGLLAIGR